MFRIFPFSYHPRTVCIRVELKGCEGRNISTNMVDNIRVATFIQAAGLDLKNETANNFEDFSEEREEWSERVLLGVSIGIMAVVGLVTLSAILLVFRSNWKLKNYSNIYSNTTNNDIDSSLQSSLKRYKSFKVS